ncbi:MAG: hypothetical protein AAF721_38065 [Myxococcota bacterium]
MGGGWHFKLHVLNVHFSRAHCSRFVVGSIPWNGLTADELGSLRRAVDTASDCPAVRPEEFEALSAGAQALSQASDLDPAVAHLLGWATRAVVLHEVRHLADAEQYGESARIDCSICTERDSPGVRREVSAYAASIGWSQSPATTLFQACDAVTDSGGLHARALERLLAPLSLSCSDAPPPDLGARMQALEARAFDRVSPITMPNTMPDSLPLPRRSTQ